MEITATEFKAKCLKIMDEIEQTREAVTITKHGKPVAQMIPFAQQQKSRFGYMEGTATINEDIVEPLDIPWEAMCEDEE